MSIRARSGATILWEHAVTRPSPDAHQHTHEARMSLSRATTFAALAVTPLWLVAQAGAQPSPSGRPPRPALSQAVRQYVRADAPLIALTHLRVIDGTGAPAREDQTLLIRDGRIAEIGGATSVNVPEGATVVDGTGKSVIPGLVMVHEHLYYPTGPGVYGQLGQSFVRLYLAGGVTTANDVAELAAAGLAGCIIGRALYEGTLTLAEALRAADGG